MKIYLTPNGTDLMKRCGMERLPTKTPTTVAYTIRADKYHEVRVTCEGIIKINNEMAGFYFDRWSLVGAKMKAATMGLDIVAEIDYLKY